MNAPHLENLKLELKELIITECERDCSADEISDNEPLFGPNSKLHLDSIDALQISMALNKKYNVKITDSKKIRGIMSSISSLAEYINQSQNS